MEKIVLLVHGMGDLNRRDFNDMVDRFEDEILDQKPGLRGKVHFEGVFYSGLLQDTQDKLWKEMRKKEIDYMALRKFFLFGFGDAGSLEHRPQDDDSVYEKAQKKIYTALDNAYGQTTGSAKVVIVAQSLGGQVISNYIWDAQSPNPVQGIWKYPPYQNLPAPKAAQQRLKHLRFIVTTGCNIPLFVCGKTRIQGVYRNQNGYDFKWHNYYDRDDVLGWPLKPLGKFFDPGARGMSYAQLVSRDIEVNADSGFFDRITTSWTPFSHTRYWRDNLVLKKIARIIDSI